MVVARAYQAGPFERGLITPEDPAVTKGRRAGVERRTRSAPETGVLREVISEAIGAPLRSPASSSSP